ncbi:MAG: patatin-like phospholipase family protein [Pseudobdellovibrio sp.]
MKKLALVLTGGGARAAYQVGVLHAIAEITGYKKIPFSIISGYSAGAINGALLASQDGDFLAATQYMVDIWSSLTAEKVFKVGAISLSKIAYRWMLERSTGGLTDGNKKNQITYLLDTSPLNDLVREKINFKVLNENIKRGLFHAFEISATNYRTGYSTAFYNGDKDIKDWSRLNRHSLRTEITAEHVLASSAIPLFFPPVKIGDSFFGDGMVRLNMPLSSAIHLGAEKLMVIGSRGPSVISEADGPSGITLGEIIGTVLNGLFFDPLDGDLERVARINRGVSAMTLEEQAHQPDGLKVVPVLSLFPQKDITRDATCELSRMPSTLAYMLRGIGVSDTKGFDLLSYLAFEPDFLNELVRSGREDTMQRKDEILTFVES